MMRMLKRIDQTNNLQTYQLHIKIHKDINIRVGRLGQFLFPAGFYIYTGSAKRGMKNRLARHISKQKKCHWHIDYLLVNPHTEIIDIKKFTEPECSIHAKTEGAIIIPGFGASDCRSKCGSHLLKVPCHSSSSPP